MRPMYGPLGTPTDSLALLGRALRACVGFLRVRSAYADDDGADGGSKNDDAAGGGGEKLFTQVDLDAKIAERLGRAERQFTEKHGLEGLKADALELAGLKSSKDDADRDKRNKELDKSGDVAAIRAEMEVQGAAKDKALQTATDSFSAFMRRQTASQVVAALKDRVHEGAAAHLATLVGDRLGVTLREDNTPEVFPTDEAGARAYDGKGDPLTTAGLAEQILGANAFMQKAAPGGRDTNKPNPDGSAPDALKPVLERLGSNPTTANAAVALRAMREAAESTNA